MPAATSGTAVQPLSPVPAWVNVTVPPPSLEDTLAVRLTVVSIGVDDFALNAVLVAY